MCFVGNNPNPCPSVDSVGIPFAIIRAAAPRLTYPSGMRVLGFVAFVSFCKGPKRSIRWYRAAGRRPRPRGSRLHDLGQKGGELQSQSLPRPVEAGFDAALGATGDIADFAIRQLVVMV